MANPVENDRAVEVEVYLLECLRAFRLGKPAPDRPAALETIATRLDRKLQRLAAMVRDESRARQADGVARGRLDDLEAIPIPGYTLTERLGRGQFGSVFRAEDHRWKGRIVAVKVLKAPVPDTTLDDDRWNRIFGEARRTAILDHRNIVRCHDHGLVAIAPGDRRAFLVMDLIEGQTLHERTRAWLDRTGPPAVRRSQAWRDHQRWIALTICQVADAAHAVHVGNPGRGLGGGVHGDIKPTNILIDAADVAYLSDFGVAIARGERGVRGGTRGFMPPEADLPGEPIGPEADVYSIGATLHDCLIGEPPAEPVGLGGPPPPPCPSVTPDLDSIRRKALHPDPSKRYRKASDLVDDLRRFLDGRTVGARPVTPRVKAWRWCRRRPWLAGGIILAIFGAGLLGRTWLDSYQRGQRIERLSKALDLSLPIVELADPESKTAGGLPLESRREVAARLLPYLDELASVRGGDPGTDATLAAALATRARLRHVLGKPEDDNGAIADLDRAGRIYRGLPETPERLVGLARTSIGLASILGPRREFARGMAAAEPAVTLLESLLARSPSSIDTKFRLVQALNVRATSRRGLAVVGLIAGTIPKDRALEMLDESKADYLRVIKLLESLVAAVPDEPKFEDWLSRMHGNLGLLTLSLASERAEEGPASLTSLRRAVTVAESLVSHLPRAYQSQEALVAAHLNLGDGLLALGEATDAESVYRLAVKSYDELNDQYPQVREFAWGKVTARKKLGEALAAQGRKPEALTLMNDALERFAHLIQVYSDVGEIRAERDDLVKQLEALN